MNKPTFGFFVFCAVVASTASAQARCTPGTGEYSVLFPSGLVECITGESSCDDASHVLDLIAQVWREGGGRVDIIARTDTVGTPEWSQDLSDRRAAYVRDQLIARGVSATDFRLEGRGDTDLHRPTRDEVAEPINNLATIRLPDAWRASRVRAREEYERWAQAERAAGRVPRPPLCPF